MDERTIGLILRTRPLTESSLIVQWVTKDFGRIHTVAKGARRPKSPFLSKLDLFYLAELSFQVSRRSDLHTLREVKVLEYRRLLRQQWRYLNQAAYCAQLLEQTTEINTPIPALFDLMTRTLDQLTQSAPTAVRILHFELRLLAELGLSPDFSQAKVSPVARGALDQLAKLEPAHSPLPGLSPSLIQEIDSFLHGFLLYHLGRLPKSRPLALRLG